MTDCVSFNHLWNFIYFCQYLTFKYSDAVSNELEQFTVDIFIRYTLAFPKQHFCGFESHSDPVLLGCLNI